MSSSEGVFELGIEFSEANNVLLMSIMEETQEEEYYGDDRLVSMIQSLEAEISDTEITTKRLFFYDALSKAVP
ncbi:hypothetical protein AAZV13_13G224900 [Glycine max]